MGIAPRYSTLELLATWFSYFQLGKKQVTNADFEWLSEMFHGEEDNHFFFYLTEEAVHQSNNTNTQNFD